MLVYGQSDFVLSKPNRGAIESNASSFDEPTAAVVAGNNIYVSDTGNNRVLSFRISAFDTAERVLGQDGFCLLLAQSRRGPANFFLFSAFRGVSGVNAIFADGVGMAVDYKSDPPALFVGRYLQQPHSGFPRYPQSEARRQGRLRPGVSWISSACWPIRRAEIRMYAVRMACTYRLRWAIDSQGDLWVADSGNSRVLRFPKPFANPGNRAANLVIGQANFTTPDHGHYGAHALSSSRSGLYWERFAAGLRHATEPRALL